MEPARHGEPPTTHWACCDALAERFPAIRVQRQRALVAAGEGQRPTMASGGYSWLDLGLFLIARYIQTVRTEEAEQLLETGDSPAEAIADELGYADPRFFIRLFKREVKLTPAQHRRKFGQLRAALRTARQE